MISDPDPGPQLVSVTVDRINSSPGIRRRHGFIHSHGQEHLPGFIPPDQEDFNSRSDLDIMGSQNHLRRERQSSGSMNPRLQLPLELGSNGNSDSFPVGVGAFFCKRFLKINWILFMTLWSMSTLLFIFLLLLCLLNEFVIYQVGLIPSRFFKVLGDKDLDAFWITTGVAFGIIVAVALVFESIFPWNYDLAGFQHPKDLEFCFCNFCCHAGSILLQVKSMKDYTGKLLTVNWRQTLCLSIHKMYFTRTYYYQLNVLDKIIDNPDQRLTQDVDKFTSIYGELLPTFVVAPFTIAFYSYKAFSNAGWYGPAGCFVFFLIGSFVNRLAMLSIVKLVVQQEKCEGDFRFIHMLIRVNSESIAFQDGSRREAFKANDSLNQLIATQNRLYFRQFILNICINLFDYVGSIISYLIVAIPIFSGMYDSMTSTELSAIISQNSFVNMYLIYQFSQLVDLSSKIAEVIGLTHRLSQLIERLGEFNGIWKDLFPFDGEDEAKADFTQFEFYRRHQAPSSPLLDEVEPRLIPAWELTHVSYSPPFRDDVLVADLTMTISVGQSLLIVGGSSAGKSSLLRILRGLWPPTHGRIKRFHPPGPEGVLYCPQKPYLAVGTLREQIIFPLKSCEDTSQRRVEAIRIVNYFKLFNLQHILDRVGGIDVPVSWNVYETLSPGEIQRLCFLRVFFHKPLIAILDESTSALPRSMEDNLYKECKRLGITTISVAHRESVRIYHQKLLSLEPNGKWTLTDI